jgi:hypothetical protein
MADDGVGVEAAETGAEDVADFDIDGLDLGFPGLGHGDVDECGDGRGRRSRKPIQPE